MLNPYIYEETQNGQVIQYNVFSRLIKDRIIFLNDEINSEVASVIVAQLLLLQSQDPSKDIIMYINSPGGSVSEGLAIYDTMQYISCDVVTICIGTAASMASILLASGTKGKRFALPHSEVMIHQPLGGTQGQASDIKIAAEHILETKEILTKILSEKTGNSFEQLEKDMDRNNWMKSEKAAEYGLIDKVINRINQK